MIRKGKVSIAGHFGSLILYFMMAGLGHIILCSGLGMSV